MWISAGEEPSQLVGDLLSTMQSKLNDLSIGSLQSADGSPNASRWFEDSSAAFSASVLAQLQWNANKKRAQGEALSVEVQTIHRFAVWLCSSDSACSLSNKSLPWSPIYSVPIMSGSMNGSVNVIVSLVSDIVDPNLVSSPS